MIKLNEKEYTMRKLGFPDVFTVSRILKAMDFKAEFEQLAKIFKESGDSLSFTNQALKMELIFKFITNLGAAEEHFYKWLVALYKIEEENAIELVKYETLDQIENMIEDFTNQPHLGKLFSGLGKLTNQKS
jgi:hypothetical protein